MRFMAGPSRGDSPILPGTQIASRGAMAAAENVLSCDACGLTQRVDPLMPGMSAECIRCGSTGATRARGGAHITLPLPIAALLPYLPADIYPIPPLHLYRNQPQHTLSARRVGPIH